MQADTVKPAGVSLSCDGADLSLVGAGGRDNRAAEVFQKAAPGERRAGRALMLCGSCCVVRCGSAATRRGHSCTCEEDPYSVWAQERKVSHTHAGDGSGWRKEIIYCCFAAVVVAHAFSLCGRNTVILRTFLECHTHDLQSEYGSLWHWVIDTRSLRSDNNHLHRKDKPSHRLYFFFLPPPPHLLCCMIDLLCQCKPLSLFTIKNLSFIKYDAYVRKVISGINYSLS